MPVRSVATRSRARDPAALHRALRLHISLFGIQRCAQIAFAQVGQDDDDEFAGFVRPLGDLHGDVSGGVYNLGTFLRDAATIVRHNHASTSDDDCFGC